MHVVSNEAPSGFKPVTVTIVLETEKELKALSMLTNFSPIIIAGQKLGIDLSEIFRGLPEGVYAPDSWDADIAPVIESLTNDAALNKPTTKAAKKATPVTYHITAEDEETGEGLLQGSDGTIYKYEIAECGEAIRVSTHAGTLISELPTSEWGSYLLNAEDLDLLTLVLNGTK